MQQFLKSAGGTAWAKVVSTQFFQKLLATVDNTQAAQCALHVGL